MTEVRAPSPAVRAAAAAARGPTLIFDGEVIEATLAWIAMAARAHAVAARFAVKSFPHPWVAERAARILGGLDVAGAEERALVAGLPGAVTSTDPGLDAAAIAALPAADLAVTCETVDQVAAVRAARPDAAIALRVSSSAVMPGDAAVGALQAGDGHRRSRFGIEADDDWAGLRELAAAARGARIGLHVHSAGAVPTSAARWAAIARAVLAAGERAGIAPAFLDLGGGWHGVATDLDAALAAVRAAVPPAIEIVIEPGRLCALGAGYAAGEVLAARRLADRELRVVSLSRVGHLRWSAIDLVARPPRPGHGRKLTIAGATCFEDDVLGDWLVEDAHPVGAPVLFAGVTGYSAAWNRGFAGVPAATIVVTGARAITS